MRADRIITLTTDFGLDDPFVGVMKGIILNINPGANVIDLCHGIASHDVRGAAFAIGMNYRFFPDRTVHVVVVDPGVGSQRRPILAATEKHYFVGPDNGVFSLVFEQEKHSLRVVHITTDRYFLNKNSATFQGRDMFAPVAAWLTRGKDYRKFGKPIDDFSKLDLPVPVRMKSALRGEIIHIDKFGNAITNIGLSDITALRSKVHDDTLRVYLGGKRVPLKKYYGEATSAALFALINSSEYLELFVNRSNAAKKFKIAIGDRVEIKITA
ncbi:MAG TPA: SAM-dependent chlorinase/fluorinase [Thermodesulfovibrionales bacterium]|nr:SAM-dependent chlorinase/fluorinase [Thermodesulfovibrionales bacterium]